MNTTTVIWLLCIPSANYLTSTGCLHKSIILLAMPSVILRRPDTRAHSISPANQNQDVHCSIRMSLSSCSIVHTLDLFKHHHTTTATQGMLRSAQWAKSSERWALKWKGEAFHLSRKSSSYVHVVQYVLRRFCQNEPRVMRFQIRSDRGPHWNQTRDRMPRRAAPVFSVFRSLRHYVRSCLSLSLLSLLSSFSLSPSNLSFFLSPLPLNRVLRFTFLPPLRL